MHGRHTPYDAAVGGADHPVLEVRQQGRRPLFVQIREPLEIGRECDGILLLDLQASRRHAVVSPRGGTVLLEDVGSTNGTFLDGVRISSPVVLTPGAVAQVGDTVIDGSIRTRLDQLRAQIG